MTNATRWWVVLCVGAVALSACTTASQRAQPPPPRPITGAPRAEAGRTPAPAMTEITLEDEDKKPPRPPIEMYPGTGTFVNPKAGAPRPPDTGGEYTLNFEATDLQEVVKAVLGDLLKESYFIDPKVTGQVTIQTSRPLKRAELLPTLENLLRLNGAVLLRSDGLYKVMPGAQATRGAPPTSVQRVAAARGYGIRVVPLRYVSARELHKLIEPFLPPDAPQIVDEQRNLLILTGTEQELESTMELVEIFDVDWLNGMSVGLFKLKDAEVKTLHAEMEKIFGEKDSPVSGVVRMVPVERLNALLVVTSRPDYLEHAREWVERLDQVADAVGPRLFVYRVQNGKAADLATVLGGIFGAEATKEDGPPAAELAPGEEPTTLDSDSPRTSEREGELGGEESGVGQRRGGRSKEPAVSVVSTENLKIIADESTNSLVILARTQDYKMIETALKNLDVVPLQVLIEASVIEVTLTDNLRYGVEWFLKHGAPGNETAQALFDLTPGGDPSVPPPTEGSIPSTIGLLGPLVAPNFSYAFLGSGSVKVILNALALESKLEVLSSPSLMVLDNQTATIKVVNQIPVQTQQQQSTIADSNIISSVEFKDAGVILEITPRVNQGGRITLDLVQEVTDVGARVPPSNNTSFFQRNIETSVTVQSAETIVIGGLITRNKSDSNTGIPILKDLPVLGTLFGDTTDTDRRTELMVLLTPKAVRDLGEARAVTKEFRERLKELEAAGPGEAPRRPSPP